MVLVVQSNRHVHPTNLPWLVYQKAYFLQHPKYHLIHISLKDSLTTSAIADSSSEPQLCYMGGANCQSGDNAVKSSFVLKRSLSIRLSPHNKSSPQHSTTQTRSSYRDGHNWGVLAMSVPCVTHSRLIFPQSHPNITRSCLGIFQHALATSNKILYLIVKKQS